MYKHVALLVRQDGMSHEEFVDYWQTNHTPIAKDIEGVVRYQQVLPTEPAHAEFDGLAELYFETLADLHEALGSPGSRDYDPTKAVAAKAREDVNNFLAVEERPRIIGEEIVQKDEVDGDTDGLYKHSAFLVRQDDMTHDEFVDYWQSNHTPIAREIEGVVKYNTVIPTDPENAEFDGVAELYFDDLEKLYDALGSEGSRDYAPDKGKAKAAREDVDNFLAIDERPRFIGQEQLVQDEG
ncbi:EthD family reductase [Haloarcula hispanica]|nr:ethyl tert-butyl ether degradation EthD [Haloarcula hispanica ATCC 33960]AJF27333.1 ethyl tert-butyl ether degradation protein EthD [Haloarcula sp. CBA1115]KAA9401176.1 EthD family reductase [Haloarcula sp. CBA1131]KAA9404847.1 EthD family reductase [Haloarcula hispanica]KZX50116.1 ethyl tert-butyl ether degradation protein EthD [Haloarcula sp. K1]MUV48553.1 EthD family reductase [Haloarcula sp. CBA1122]